MLVVSMLLAPTLMLTAVRTEQRRGATAAGWVAALPVSLPIGIVTVALDSGAHVASRLALSAAGHVAAQVVFAGTTAVGLRRWGVPRGFAAGVGSYVLASVLLAGFAPLIAAALAVPALLIGPRYVRPQGSAPSGRRHPWVTALTCAGASVVVLGFVLGSRLCGPEIGGALGAFPAASTLLAASVIRRSGTPAGADALAGMIRCLPCYLACCVIAAVMLAAPTFT